MSKREEVAQELADFIIENNLCNPFGGTVNKAKNEFTKRTYYSVLFSRPAILDGEVQVYGEKFIRIISFGPAGGPPEVLRSKEGALNFLKEKFA